MTVRERADVHGGKSRRKFLMGLTALGAGAVIPGCRTAGRAHEAPDKPYRIDVHHHMVSPAYSAALETRSVTRPIPWTAQRSIEEMNASGIAISMLSLPSPSVAFGDMPLARKLARDTNEYAAKVISDHPGRYGLLAAVPLSDTEGSLVEIEYALDRLKADGIALMTSYGGKYLGDAAFSPVLEELNRRKVVVYTHPTPPQCCARIMPYTSPNTIEGPVDTTRTMASLLFLGAAARYPDIRWIFSHGGGVTPFLLSRFQQHEAIAKDSKEKMPNGLMHELRKFYYDMAQSNHPGALDALRKIAPVSRYLYGTDFPFRNGAEVNGGLTGYGFSALELQSIDRDNALRLFPRLA